MESNGIVKMNNEFEESKRLEITLFLFSLDIIKRREQEKGRENVTKQLCYRKWEIAQIFFKNI